MTGLSGLLNSLSWGDPFDDPRVEAVCLDLADAAGIQVPERRLRVIGPKTVLLVRRFDRTAEGDRYGYLSAATLLKHSATAYHTSRTYVDIAVVARTIGVAEPEPEIYRRLLVNSFLHNTDDHLRNMAFLSNGKGWRISPAFDLVPHRMGRHVCAPASESVRNIIHIQQRLHMLRSASPLRRRVAYLMKLLPQCGEYPNYLTHVRYHLKTGQQ